ncbi:cofilin/actin-depolymerizing factor homolog [Drosophila guanche]|uniref:Blast:Cofilin/actin-depolymerizing factor homolog n=1 Tax=Drosophila guanche TaxID=7266 RepID=A0A3B0J7U0_DROGU|nr:cofilin/actin-depolymerizing factor homolog [Drosophila guanche]SPP77895.1 blast:Cofilin/actin-depolymerizing factor homolog [Drosophila guanche]
MDSGIELTRAAKRIFEQIRQQRQHRFATFAICPENSQILVDAVGERAASYEDFLRDLQGRGHGQAGQAKCRFAIYDYEYEHQFKDIKDSCPSIKQKLVLLLWCPEQAAIKDKILYASSIFAIMRGFIGIQKFIQANQLEQVQQEAIELQLRALDRD